MVPVPLRERLGAVRGVPVLGHDGARDDVRRRRARATPTSSRTRATFRPCGRARAGFRAIEGHDEGVVTRDVDPHRAHTARRDAEYDDDGGAGRRIKKMCSTVYAIEVDATLQFWGPTGNFVRVSTQNE